MKNALAGKKCPIVFGEWHIDPGVAALTLIGVLLYGLGVYAYARRRGRQWPWWPLVSFCAAVISGWLALESPLDELADNAFAPHMVQHLILTDITAPLLLLSAPAKLWLGAIPLPWAKRSTGVFHSRLSRIVTNPVATWFVFIVTLWGVHFTQFFELALENENIHALEHALFLGAALLYWLPVIGAGVPAFGIGTLTYPVRLLYLLVTMPAEAILGFALYTARAPLYAGYRHAGLADQQAAGEIMWIGATTAMFVAFMLVGVEWARSERKIAGYE